MDDYPLQWAQTITLMWFWSVFHLDAMKVWRLLWGVQSIALKSEWLFYAYLSFLIPLNFITLLKNVLKSYFYVYTVVSNILIVYIIGPITHCIMKCTRLPISQCQLSLCVRKTSILCSLLVFSHLLAQWCYSWGLVSTRQFRFYYFFRSKNWELSINF